MTGRDPDLGASGPDNTYGHGRINGALAGSELGDPPTPTPAATPNPGSSSDSSGNTNPRTYSNSGSYTNPGTYSDSGLNADSRAGAVSLDLGDRSASRDVRVAAWGLFG